MVWIPPNIGVVQDVTSPRLKWLRVDGQFSPATTGTPVPPPAITLDQLIATLPTAEQLDVRNAITAASVDSSKLLPMLPRPPPPVSPITLWVDTLVTTMGSTLSAGHAQDPYQGQWTILIADYGPVDLTKDPFFLSRGVHIMGSVAIYGRKVAERCFTTGNKAGDTVVSLLQPAVGWRLGDTVAFPRTTFVLPTWSNPNPQSDYEEIPIQAISSDLKTITLAAPLKNDHGAFDRFGGARPIFCANVSRRSINFESENKTVIGQRGHWMIMYDPNDTMSRYHEEHTSTIEFGRTDKSKIVTDPDGLGNGLANPRARYAKHPHRCGPDLLDAAGNPRMMIEVFSCLIYGSPGWGLVDHDSACNFDKNIICKVFGSAISCEIGTERCCICDNTIMELMAPYSTNNDVTDRNNADFGFAGVGIWTQGGAVQVCGQNIVTGATDHAMFVMGLPFTLNGNITRFASKNLPAPFKSSDPTVPCSYVPQIHSGLRWFGCAAGIMPYALNGNPSITAPIGRSSFSDFRGEQANSIVSIGYSSNLDFSDFRGVGLTLPVSAGEGYRHTDVSTNITYTRTEAAGYEIAFKSPTGADNSYADCTATRSLCGLLIHNAFEIPRTVAITNFTYTPPNSAELSAIIKVTNNYTYPYFCNVQGKQPAKIVMRLDQIAENIYGPSEEFTTWLQGQMYFVNTDSVTLDGDHLFFPELHDSFALNLVPSCPANLKALTNGQLWSQYGVRIGATLLPADVAPLTGSVCYHSSSPATVLTPILVTKYQNIYDGGLHNYQQTNVVTGYSGQVKVNGQFVQFGPANLLDKTLNFVPITVSGMTRGVPVKCDSSLTAPLASW